MRYLYVIIFFAAFIKLFSVAARGISLTKINAVSLVFYYLLFYEAIGSSIIYLGFRNHYLLYKVRNEATFDITYYCLTYAMLMMPIIIILVNQRYKSNNPHNEIKVEVESVSDDINKYYQIVCFLTIISAFACAYTFYSIGYVSFFRILTSSNLEVMRIKNAHDFAGSQYIRNLLFLSLSPILSFASYIFYKSSKEQRWKRIVIANFIITILAKTYDFSKSPIIVFFIIIYIIEGFFEENRAKAFKRLLLISGTIIALILFSYVVIAKYSGQTWLSLNHGPASRILITQVANMYLHIDIFPKQHAFLNGASFPAWIGRLFGQSDWGMRSGQLVMKLANPSSVAAGTAGVSNTIYLGEAYANWGYVGIILSPIWVGLIFGWLQNFIQLHRRSPMNLIVYIVLLNIFCNTLEGGFVDFIYSLNVIFSLFIIFVIYSFGNNFKIKIPTKKSKMRYRDQW